MENITINRNYFIKIFSLFFGAVLCTATVEAQVRASDSYIISGQVIDSLANEPVPYATVAVAFTRVPAEYVNTTVISKI